MHVARRFHGIYYSGGWCYFPGATFQHGDARARLTLVPLRSHTGERCLQLAVQQLEITSRCEIFYYQTREAMLPLRRGLLPVEFDWADFRRRWQVLAEDGDAVKHLLSDGMRLAIELAWRQPVPAEMTISLMPGWLIVRKVWHAPRGSDLESFVERVLALSDQISLAAAVGIEFVTGEQPQLLEEARCGVCGESLADEIVVCRRCNTPQHRDCWQFSGGCATYGCGGRECTVPAIAPLTNSRFDAPVTAVSRLPKPR